MCARMYAHTHVRVYVCTGVCTDATTTAYLFMGVQAGALRLLASYEEGLESTVQRHVVMKKIGSQ